MASKKISIQVRCSMCEKLITMEVNEEDYKEYRSPEGRHIQDIFPYLSPDERELLISRTCGPCFDILFNEEV